MARPRKVLNAIRVHVELDENDYRELREIFGPSIGISAAIRIAIRKFLEEHGALAREIIDRNML